ncbi:HigA family addiction module antitoxin [Mycobacteroides abscessus]|uniref:HigA family addiction module antitoxin n=1 Tax=Mycobacteroides abscessus TaxID=36809 RepID=UPI001F3F112F|nr:HigA family addiction module antitoxin [Mycobacteroides abscessus]
MTTTNYAVAPGEYLQEWIDEQGFSQQRVAEMLGCSRKQVNEIIHGRAPIAADTAMRLARVVEYQPTPGCATKLPTART